MSGTITEKYIIDSVCAFARVGLKIQKGDPDMIKRAHETNTERIHEAQERAKNNAIKANKILMPLIKKYKLKNYFGEMPEDYDDFPPGSAGYSEYPQIVRENNADEFLNKECMYSFLVEEIGGNSEIIFHFIMLPDKEIRDIIVNAVKNKIRKEEVIAIAVKYLNDNNLSDNFFQDHFTADEFDEYWDVYFKNKEEHGTLGKCLFRVNKSYGDVKQITIK